MEFQSSKGIFLQIADSLCHQILEGLLKPGDRVPSVRDLAEEYEVNRNTVMRTYTILQESGIFDNKRGIGFFISENAIELVRASEKANFFNHELPDFIIPYKRHEAQTIEAIVDGHDNAVPCEVSTIHRIRAWFAWMIKHLQGCIDACRMKYGDEIVPFSLLRPISDDDTPVKGWLTRAVHLAVNSNNWCTYPIGVFVR